MLVVDWRLALAAFAVIPLVVSDVARLSHQSPPGLSGHPDSARADQRVPAGTTHGHAHRAALRTRAQRGRRGSTGSIAPTWTRICGRSPYYALYFPAIEILTSIAMASLIVAAAGRVHATTLKVGMVAAFFQLVRRFFQPLQDLSDKYNTLQQAMASSERIFKLLDEPGGRPAACRRRHEGAGDRQASGRADGAPAPAGCRRGAASSAAASRSPSRMCGSRTTSRTWPATAPRPRRAGVGAQGCELPRRARRDGRARRPYGRGQNDRGEPAHAILRSAAGADHAGRRRHPADAGRAMLRARIGYVQQDIFLFAGDVASNIRLSSPLPMPRWSARRSGSAPAAIIRRLPDGYHYQLGERGASISVGERQLLSFARAIAADPALLILDEATSAVDSEIEAEIQAALAELMRGRTTIADRASPEHDRRCRRDSRNAARRDPGARHAPRPAGAGGLYERLYRLQVGEAPAAV